MNIHLTNPTILAQHQPPLEKALQSLLPTDAVMLASLYCYAHEFALQSGLKEAADSRIVLAKQSSGGAGGYVWQVTAESTDKETGVYVSLSGCVNTKSGKGVWDKAPLLTVGRKFVQETQPAQIGNTAVKYWR
jgi:hypothetical protein